MTHTSPSARRYQPDWPVDVLGILTIVVYGSWYYGFGVLIDEIGDGRQSLSPDFQTIIAVSSTFFGESPSHSVSKSASFETAFPPLSRLMTEVAGLGKFAGKRRVFIYVGNQFSPLSFVEFGIGGSIFGRWIVSCNAMLVSIVPRNHCHEGRPAKRCRNITPAKHDALSGELI